MMCERRRKNQETWSPRFRFVLFVGTLSGEAKKLGNEVTVPPRSPDPTTGTRSEIKLGIDPKYFTDGLGHFYNSYDPTPRSGFHPVK